MTCAQQQDGGKSDPATDGMHHHRPGEVVKVLAEQALYPILPTQASAPGHAFENGVDQSNQDGRGDQLRPKLGSLGNAARNNGGNGCGKGGQEEELHQIIATRSKTAPADLAGNHTGAGQECDAIGHGITHKEIGKGRDRKVCNNFNQGIDLILLANSTELQERESSVHREDWNVDGR